MPVKYPPRSYAFPLKIGTVTVHAYPTDNFYTIGTESAAAPPHNHAQWEFRYFERGTIVYTLGENKLTCCAGQYLLIPPGVAHKLDPEDNAGLLEDCIHYNMLFSIQPEENTGLQDYFSRIQLIQSRGPQLLQLLQVLRDELLTASPGYLTSIPGILTAVFVELLRNVNTIREPLFHDDDTPYLNQLYRSLDYIFTSHATERLTISDMAQKSGLPVHVVHRAIKEIYGVTFSQRLRLLRVEAAKLLLRNTNKSVTEIAVSCGFESSNAFYTAFKKLENITPLQYRSRWREVNQEEEKRREEKRREEKRREEKRREEKRREEKRREEKRREEKSDS